MGKRKTKAEKEAEALAAAELPESDDLAEEWEDISREVRNALEDMTLSEGRDAIAKLWRAKGDNDLDTVAEVLFELGFQDPEDAEYGEGEELELEDFDIAKVPGVLGDELRVRIKEA